MYLESKGRGNGDMEIPETHRPVSLASLASSEVSEISSLNIRYTKYIYINY